MKTKSIGSFFAMEFRNERQSVGKQTIQYILFVKMIIRIHSQIIHFNCII